MFVSLTANRRNKAGVNESRHRRAGQAEHLLHALQGKRSLDVDVGHFLARDFDGAAATSGSAAGALFTALRVLFSEMAVTFKSFDAATFGG
jgi:hypothetical protein